MFNHNVKPVLGGGIVQRVVPSIQQLTRKDQQLINLEASQ